MSSLSEIENKIAALRQRYAELDEKLVPRRGVVDGSVSTAMGVITKELGRLELLRQDALTVDLVGDTSTTPKTAPSRAAAAALPMPVFATRNADAKDPLAGLERLPDGEQERADLYRELAGWACEQVNSDLERRQKAAEQDIPVVFTQGFFKSLIVLLGMMQAEYRWLVAMGRDRRKSLEDALLKRIEALEAQPALKYLGVWSGESIYPAGTFVTDAGSMWHAQRASVGERPGTGDAWVLAVKKGKDGRDVGR